MDSPWNDAKRLEQLHELWPNRDLSVSEIAHRLGVSPAAVTGKAHRLGLPARPSPVLNFSIKGKRRGPPPTPGMRRGPTAKTTLPTLESAIGITLPSAPAPAFAPARITECCWPLTESRPWLFCEAPTVPGNRYCAKHREWSMFGKGGAAGTTGTVPDASIPAATGESLQSSGESPSGAVTISSESESSNVAHANVLPSHDNQTELAAVA